MPKTDQYGLIMFDLDGTLAEYKSDVLYPDVAEYLKNTKRQAGAIMGTPSWVIVTNQGGIGLRHWMEFGNWGNPETLPTLEDFSKRIDKLFPDVHDDYKFWIFMCARYQSKKGVWSPIPDHQNGLAMWNKEWRKPQAGMLHQAMIVTGYPPGACLMVGDREEDQLAAEAAKVDFMWAYEFFGREKPSDEQ